MSSKFRVSFGELRIGATARKHLNAALDKNWVSEGENTREFERRFAAHFGYRHAVATSSGTDADIVACAALHDFGARRGDEIIVPACSFVATANSILAAGFVPRFVDVRVETLNLDETKLEAAIGPKTRAIMAVHTMGKPCEMDTILAIAQKHGLAVIEDSCEAHGAKYRGRVIGSFGQAAMFSFYIAHLICCGEGGMVTTNDDEWEKVLRSVKSHGRPYGSIFFEFQRFGTNSKMNDMEAALGLEGIESFDETFEIRKRHVYRLLEQTKELEQYCHFVVEQPHEVVSPHAFPVTLREARFDLPRLYAFLEENGVQCKTNFGSLPTQHRAFAFMGHRRGEFPASEYVGENGLHFGVHRYLSDADVDHAAEMLRGYFKKYA